MMEKSCLHLPRKVVIRCFNGSDVRVAPESLFNLDAGIASAYIIDASALCGGEQP